MTQMVQITDWQLHRHFCLGQFNQMATRRDPMLTSITCASWTKVLTQRIRSNCSEPWDLSKKSYSRASVTRQSIDKGLKAESLNTGNW